MREKPGFTPGPWRLQYHATQEGNGGKAENWLIGSNDHLILKMPAWTAEHGHNAHLIAGAPAMFGKLVDTVAWLDREISEEDMCGKLTELRDDLAETLRKIMEGE